MLKGLSDTIPLGFKKYTLAITFEGDSTGHSSRKTLGNSLGHAFEALKPMLPRLSKMEMRTLECTICTGTEDIEFKDLVLRWFPSMLSPPTGSISLVLKYWMDVPGTTSHVNMTTTDGDVDGVFKGELQKKYERYLSLRH